MAEWHHPPVRKPSCMEENEEISICCGGESDGGLRGRGASRDLSFVEHFLLKAGYSSVRKKGGGGPFIACNQTCNITVDDWG